MTRPAHPRRAARGVRFAALAAVALALAALALPLAACAPLTRPNATETVTIVPETRDEVMVVELPLDLPAGGVTVVPSRRPAFEIPLSQVPPEGYLIIA